MSFPKAYADRVAKLRVFFGFAMVAAFVWFSAPTPGSLAAGLPVAFAGLALRAWAAGHLEKNRDLAQSGPYRFVRNPLYVGTLLCAAGFAIGSRRWELGALFAAVFLLVYLPVVELEEQHLRGLFSEYAEYALRVPRLLPFAGGRDRGIARGPGGPPPKQFQWSLYRRNREYEALAGFLAGVALLGIKAF